MTKTAISITIKKSTLSINDIEHQNAQNPCAQCHDADCIFYSYAQCHYAEYHSAESHGEYIIKLIKAKINYVAKLVSVFCKVSKK